MSTIVVFLTIAGVSVAIRFYHLRWKKNRKIPFYQRNTLTAPEIDKSIYNDENTVSPVKKLCGQTDGIQKQTNFHEGKEAL